MISVGQSRAVPSSACARTIAATWSTVSARVGERDPPAAVDLEVPERRGDPLVRVADLVRAVRRARLGDRGRPGSRPATTGPSGNVARSRPISVPVLIQLAASRIASAHFELGAARFAACEGGGDEVAEQRVGLRRLRLELRVALHGQEPRVVRQLDHLDQLAVGARAGDDQAVRLELLAVVRC